MHHRFQFSNDLESEQGKLVKEAKAISDLGRKNPNKALNWAVNQYLNSWNILRYKMKDLQAINLTLCDNLMRGMDKERTLAEFVKGAEGILDG